MPSSTSWIAAGRPTSPASLPIDTARTQVLPFSSKGAQEFSATAAEHGHASFYSPTPLASRCRLSLDRNHIRRCQVRMTISSRQTDLSMSCRNSFVFSSTSITLSNGQLIDFDRTSSPPLLLYSLAPQTSMRCAERTTSSAAFTSSPPASSSSLSLASTSPPPFSLTSCCSPLELLPR